MTKIEELKKRFKEGVVTFTYTKKDGSERIATGTTNVDIVAEHDATPKGTGYAGDTDVTTRYYDIISEGWRSFRNENLVCIND